VCRREAQCVDKIAEKSPDEEEQTRFDQSECVSACNVLTRDPLGVELFERHVACVEKAGDDCEALLTCE
jgi:hypothetical protein